MRGVPPSERVAVAQRVLDLASDAVIVTDTAGRIVSWNHAAQLLLGPSADEAIGHDLATHLRALDSDIGAVLAARANVVPNVRLEGLRGRRPIVDIRASHEAWGMLILIRDRTEQVEGQELLQEVHERQRELEALGDVGLWQLDRSTGDLQLSEQVFTILGLDPIEAHGTLDELVALVRPDHREELRSAVDAARGSAGLTLDVPIIRRDGAERWLHLRASASSASPVLLSGIVQDVTPMRDALEAAEHANEELIRFAGTVAHDLRSPLATVAGLASLLVNPNIPKENFEEIVRRIMDNANRASEQVSHLLEEARRTTAQLAPVDLNAVALWVSEIVRQQLDDATATLTWADLPSIPGREALVRQCVLNLVTNAIKYGRARDGIIQIAARRADGAWDIAVEDDGPGVEPDAREMIFEDGTRLEQHAGIVGSGIGLAAVRRAMERMGGTVRADQAASGGAAFILRFPDGVADDAAPPQPATAEVAG